MLPQKVAGGRLGVLSTHPIQYYAPWYRKLAESEGIDLTVFYAHKQTPAGQAAEGFGVHFEWDIPLLEGYRYEFLPNLARRPSVSTFWGCNTPVIADRIEQGNFDGFLVHGWYNRSFWQAMRACWRVGTPVMVRGDSQLVTRQPLLRTLVKQVSHRWFVPRFDAYLVVGSRAREYYEHFGADPRRMFSVPHFVNNQFFADSAERLRADRASLRQRFGIQPNALVLLFVGKFITKKRPLDFVRAVACSAKTNLAVNGIMIGDGPMRAEIEGLRDRLDAPVRLLGFFNQSEMPRAYVAADALVLPSDGGETWGLVVNEAMASGLPVLVSNECGCAPDLVREGRTGYTFRCGDVVQLAERIRQLAADPSLLAEIAKGAQSLIDEYAIETAVEGTRSALRHCAVISRRNLKSGKD